MAKCERSEHHKLMLAQAKRFDNLRKENKEQESSRIEKLEYLRRDVAEQEKQAANLKYKIMLLEKSRNSDALSDTQDSAVSKCGSFRSSAWTSLESDSAIHDLH
eukprot:Colp12_sorted_trinity150504_noHs@4023